LAPSLPSGRALVRARSRRLSACLGSVKSRLDRVQADGQSLIKELEKLYDIELLRLPIALREMNWLGYFGMTRAGKAGLGAGADVEISEINKITAKVIQTPFKTIKKGQFVYKRCYIALCAVRSTGCVTAFLLTGLISYISPYILDSFRIFKTPGLRTPAVNEPVFIVSKNGSPLANTNDVIITVPLKGGEALRFTASDLTKRNLHQLNPEALGVMKNLSVSLYPFSREL
uniref:Borealin n=1 Tax=Crocodylus porosus TaxID=8502 RepID=A0A7M4E2W1_CROPO